MKSSLRSKKRKTENSKIPSPSVSCSAVLFSTFVVGDVTCPQYHISHSPLPKSFHSPPLLLLFPPHTTRDEHFIWFFYFYSFEFVLYEFMFKCFSTSHFLSVFLTWLTKGQARRGSYRIKNFLLNRNSLFTWYRKIDTITFWNKKHCVTK